MIYSRVRELKVSNKNKKIHHTLMVWQGIATITLLVMAGIMGIVMLFG